MGYLLLSATISFIVAFFFIRQAGRGSAWGTDRDFDGPQKFHRTPVPRLGGAGILAALLVCASLAWWRSPAEREMLLLLACGLPAVAFGLAEDVTLAIRPRTRLLAAAFSAFLGAMLLGVVVKRTDFVLLDTLLSFSVIAIPLTIFAVAGIANSVNIIDGFNGLASMVCMMMFGAIAWVAYQVGDSFILATALSCIGALAGFFLWNFPRGRIFLGDGGAYLMGFLVAELALMLFLRHPQVSPWFAVLLFFYPTVETVFSIYRRRVLQGVPISSPDASHLHSLIFRRLLRSGRCPDGGTSSVNCNARTSLYLWALASLAVLPAALFWDNTPVILLFCAVFVGVYLWLYQSIVRFRTPGWLLLRARREVKPAPLVPHI